MKAKTLVERQKKGLDLRFVGTNIPMALYNQLVDYAYANRFAMTKAITELLTVGLAAVENEKESSE